MTQDFGHVLKHVKEQYWFELNRRDRYYQDISIVASILALLAGGFTYLLFNYSIQPGDALYYLRASICIIYLINFVLCVSYCYKVFNFEEYEYIHASIKIVEYYDGWLKHHSNDTNMAKISFDNSLAYEFAEIADINFMQNEKRSKYLHNLKFCVACNVLILSLFVITTYIHNISINH